MTKMTNKVKQVGGTHYDSGAIQPWDEIMRIKLNWSQGEILKYLCRHPKKGKRQDLEKALSIAIKSMVEKLRKPCDIEYGTKFREEFLEQYTGIYATEDLFSLFKTATSHLLQCKWPLLISYIQQIEKEYYGS